MLKKILQRPVTVAMIFLAVAVFGMISYSKLPVNLLPNIKYPSLTIWTEYEGNSPEEVEKEITEPLEGAIGAVKGITTITSTSKDGISLIKVDFDWGSDMDFAVLSLREKLDGVTLPDLAGRPNIVRIDPSEKPIMGLSVSGGNLYDIRNTSEDMIKRRLEQVDGVAVADVVGGEEKEITIEVDLDVMNMLGITFSEVNAAIRSANIEQTGGTIRDDVYLYDLRISSQFEDLKDIEDTLVKQTENGKNIFIRDVAQVRLKDKDREAFTRFNESPAVGILIRKNADANAVTVSDEVNKVLEEIKEANPDLIIEKAYDQAVFITESIDSVVSAVLYGGILAFITLFFFLRNYKAPINIALSIPISILATFSLIYFSGITINLMTLSGLALGVGMLVDNSIVILENITRHKEMGKDVLTAAVDGAYEVAMPVTASTITTVIVFMPIVFITGVAGELFKDQSIAVTFSLISSLVVSLTLVPVIFSRLHFDFFSNNGDKSLKSEATTFFKVGSYWFFLVGIVYMVLLLLGVPNSIELMGYSAAVAMILDLMLKWFENFLRIRELKKRNREKYETTGKNLRFFAINKLSLLVIVLFSAGAVYMTRVDFFEPFYKIFNLTGLDYLTNDVAYMLYDISNSIKEIFQPYEESMGTVSFMWVVYSIGIVGFILNIFNLFSFNFLRKLDDTDRQEIYCMERTRILIASTFISILRRTFLLLKFWIKSIIGLILIIFKPVLYVFDICFEAFKKFYHKLLIKAIENRGVTIIVSLILLLMTAVIGMAIEKRLMPEIDSGEFIIEVELIPGASLDKTESVVKKYEEILMSYDETDLIFSQGGVPDEKSKINGSTIYKGNLQVKLKKGSNTKEFINLVRKDIEAYNKTEPDKIKYNFITEVSTLSDFLKSEDADVAVKIFGENFSEMEEISEKVMEKLEAMESLSEIKSNFISKKPKIEITFKHDILKQKRILPGEIEKFITTLVKGQKVSEFTDFTRKIDIIVTREEERRYNMSEIAKAFFVKNGVRIPLNQLIDFHYKESPESVEREDQQRVITISANISEGAFNEVIAAIEKEMNTVELYKGYKIEVGGQNEEMKKSFEQLIFMFLLSTLLVYMVLASQFESLVSPFIIIFAVPFSLLGVAVGLFLFGESLNVMSVIGIIILIGIVVNDAIVKVDFIDKERLRGLSKKEAILAAGEKRLRPILMTTISTVFGMIPMAIGLGGSSELRKPLAIAVIFGLSFATFLTLVVIPVIYSVFKKDKKIVQ